MDGDFQELLTRRVKVERNSVTGLTQTRQEIIKKSPVISELKCDIQYDRTMIVYGPSGSTAISLYDMICDLEDIKEKDFVTDLDTEEKFQVIGVGRFENVEPHLEVKLKSGVV